ncbi:hypothetical protein EW026_g6147 [Hermanssonia centrifuga]|uniref:Uncharacterized protein n=1 Tax=Hermanssonia centrifuga TaxID=98765 RepID=A0A4S4KBY4_9APHY|nr:hypothetical protein EW026_g6147 [Hermanssonia centrifuga]
MLPISQTLSPRVRFGEAPVFTLAVHQDCYGVPSAWGYGNTPLQSKPKDRVELITKIGVCPRNHDYLRIKSLAGITNFRTFDAHTIFSYAPFLINYPNTVHFVSTLCSDAFTRPY